MSTGKQYRTPLLHLLCSISEPSDMEEVLQLILSQGELERLARRLQIFRMLAQGIPQREIAGKLNLGIATVTRGAAAFRKDSIAELERKIREYSQAEKK